MWVGAGQVLAASQFGAEATGIDLFSDRLGDAVTRAEAAGSARAPPPCAALHLFFLLPVSCAVLDCEHCVGRAGVSGLCKFVQADCREFDFSPYAVRRLVLCWRARNLIVSLCRLLGRCALSLDHRLRVCRRWWS